MPRKAYYKCYFGCENDRSLHKFPNPDAIKMEDLCRFKEWKSVLDVAVQVKGDHYIFDNLRICDRHFNECYRLPSHRLTRNAVPTLYLDLDPARPTSEVNASYKDPIPGPSSLTNIASVNDAELMAVDVGLDPSKRISEIGSSYRDPASGPSSLIGAVSVDPGANKQNYRKSTVNQKLIVQLQNKIAKLKAKYKNRSKLLKCARQMSMKKSFLKCMEKLPECSQIFTNLQLKGLKKARGRRFTEKEKVMALTIYKQSPKAYKFLRNIFVLPSKRCIQDMLSAISLNAGINDNILRSLSNAVKKMNEEKKLVNFLFDEISLAPGLEYNPKIGKIIGFEDLGTICKKSLADHALVLMIKGIKSKHKQPICYSFCKGTTKAIDLKEIIKTAIIKLQEIGLKVVATICDQATTNVKVIKMFQADTMSKYLRNGEEYRSGAFEINNFKIYPLFDTPHLLKGVRNNLLTKNAKFMQNGVVKWAKWEHLHMLLNIDTGSDEIRLVNKITEYHIVKEKIPKMKVKHAAKVFSQRVSAALRFLAKHKILPAECENTADFLLLFDNLFDSFNGHSYQQSIKKYKSCFKNSSPHIQLWNDSLPILESIKFQSIVRRNECNIIKLESAPSIKNWIHNIKIFKEMWFDLNNNYNVTSLLTRNFNQDPLENFFSSIRSNGLRNINPTCNQFINSYKTLIINNLNSPHSLSANCEKDDNYLFQSLIHLLKQPAVDSPNVDYACEVDSIIAVMGSIKNGADSILHTESKKYVTGFIIKRCKSIIFKNCSVCMRDFCSSKIDIQSFTYQIDYTKKSLFYPSESFNELMNEIYYLIVACLRVSPDSSCLKDKVKFLLNCACDYKMITCKIHKNQLIEFINNLSIKLIIHSWCTGVNRIINGKISVFDKNDPIKEDAMKYYEKNKKIKR